LTSRGFINKKSPMFRPRKQPEFPGGQLQGSVAFENMKKILVPAAIFLVGCSGTLPSSGNGSSGATTDSTLSTTSGPTSTTAPPPTPTPPVKCGMNKTCNTDAAPVCCYNPDDDTAQCVSSVDACAGSAFACDDDQDCDNNDVCCAAFDAVKGVTTATCVPLSAGCSDGFNGYNPNALSMCTDSDWGCPAGYACVDYPGAFPASPDFYDFCQLIPYGPCFSPWSAPTCFLAGTFCQTFTIQNTLPVGHICTQSCTTSQDCPPSKLLASAAPTCLDNQCYLDCTDQGDSACPTDMQCVENVVFSGNIIKDICLW